MTEGYHEGKYTTALSVQFNDVDPENRLTFKGAARLMQEDVNLHSEYAHQGINYMYELGYSWVLRQQKCVMYRRPGWNTHLSVTTWSRGSDGFVCLRDFQVKDDLGNLVAQATTTWLPVDIRTGHMMKPTGDVLEAYGTVTEHLFAEPLGRLSAVKDAPKVWEYKTQKRDIDINHHVNNLCYLDFAMESLPEGLDETDFAEAEILYKKPVLPGEVIGCYAGWQDENSLVTAVKDESGKSLHAVVRLRKKTECA